MCYLVCIVSNYIWRWFLTIYYHKDYTTRATDYNVVQLTQESLNGLIFFRVWLKRTQYSNVSHHRRNFHRRILDILNVVVNNIHQILYTLFYTKEKIHTAVSNNGNNKISELLNFVIHKCLSKATKLQWPRGKKSTSSDTGHGYSK